MSTSLGWVPERVGGEGETASPLIIPSRNFSANQKEVAAREGGL